MYDHVLLLRLEGDVPVVDDFTTPVAPEINRTGLHAVEFSNSTARHAVVNSQRVTGLCGSIEYTVHINGIYVVSSHVGDRLHVVELELSPILRHLVHREPQLVLCAGTQNQKSCKSYN